MSHCPTCTSVRIVKNGRIHNGKQRFLGRECGRQFIQKPTKKVIENGVRELIDRLLLERVSLAGIARVAEVSESWLQRYVNAKLCAGKIPGARLREKYAGVARTVEVMPKKKGG